MKLARVLRMGVRELADRGRQEAWRRIDRSRVRRSAWPPVTGSGQAVSAATLEAVLTRMRWAGVGGSEDEGSPRFFEGAVCDSTPVLVAERLPAWRERVVARAEALCRGEFDLLGYRQLSFGEPPDWHLDPVSGRRAPLVHWSRLDPLDAARVGDSKVVWELNRHQWLVQLGHAYRLTGEERYAETFTRHVGDWMRENPPGLGINWASSLEVALRLIAWCWALALFGRSPTLTTELGVRMLAAIWVHARHVERHLSVYFSPNTHLTGEALGLFYAGVLFPEFRRSTSWRVLGTRVLVTESQRQVLPDGVYFEQSTYYQRYSVEIYLHFLILAARNGVTVPVSVGDRVRRMLDFLLAVRQPDGAMPQVGDADGGSLLPLVPREPDDPRAIFSTAAAFFGRPDLAWAAGEVAPETLWLLGSPGLAALDALSPAPPSVAAPSVFPEGGYVVMRSGFDAEAHHLIFDVGPLGCPVTGGHGHADLLTVQCSAFGEPFLVDPGTYGYRGDVEWRDFFRSTAAHSTVVVDGEGQAIPAGPFRWRTRPRARLRRWSTAEGLLLAEGDHPAYRRLSDPVLHRRRVLFVGNRYWVLVDELEGTGEHRVDVQLQFAPMEVIVEPSSWIRAQGRRGHGLLVRAFATVPLTVERWEGERAPLRGWLSPAYGCREPAPLVVHRAVATLPLRIATLLLPVRDPATRPPEATLVLDARERPAELVLGHEKERVALC
jgi:uncharacterized heparinase superfamily protein